MNYREEDLAWIREKWEILSPIVRNERGAIVVSEPQTKGTGSSDIRYMVASELPKGQAKGWAMAYDPTRQVIVWIDINRGLNRCYLVPAAPKGE